MRKKTLKKKIILALCLGATCSTPAVYAADATLDPITVTQAGTSNPIYGYSVPASIAAIDITNGSITVSVDNSNWSVTNPTANVLGFVNDNPSAVTLQGTTGQILPITVSARGGISSVVDEYGDSSAEAVGISGNLITIKAGTSVQATATGGTGSGNSTSSGMGVDANARATGISGNATTVNGDATVRAAAAGGQVTTTNTNSDTGNVYADAYTSAYAAGIAGPLTVINGNAAIQATATGGKATTVNSYSYAHASADAFGITGIATTITGDALIQAIASGGTASTNDATDTYGEEADANAKAYGIGGSGYGPSMLSTSMAVPSLATTIEGNATIRATAIGGTANSKDINNYGAAAATAAASGISGSSMSYGFSASAERPTTPMVTITGNAVIQATAIGGKANAIGADSTAAATAVGIGRIPELGPKLTLSALPPSSVTISGNATIQATATGGAATGNNTDASAYAAGILADGSTIEIGGNAAITATATGGTAVAGSAANADATAVGIVAAYGSTVGIGGNAVITATATGGTATGTHVNTDAYAYALYADSSEININQTAGNPSTVQLIGDVGAQSNSVINLTLSNSTSFLRGNVLTDNGSSVHLTLANNAVWQPVYDNRNGTYNTQNQYFSADPAYISYSEQYSSSTNTISTLILDGGIVNLAWDNPQRTTGRTLNIGTLSGSGGKLIISTDVTHHTGDTIRVAAVSQPTTLQTAVAYDAILATGATYTGAVTNYAVVTGDGAGNITLVGTPSESGEYAITPTFTGTNLTYIDMKPSSNTKAAVSSASGQTELLRINHLRKRLGDLRNTPDTQEGIWGRVFTGEVTNDKFARVESDYTGIQVGYDKSKPVNNGRSYLGGALSYTTSDDSFNRGAGKSKAYDAALYQTWIGNDGHYYDIIAKHGRIATDYHVTDNSGNYSTADYHTWADSLSVEYGYKKQLSSGWYLEPQTELTFAHMRGVNYTTSAGLNIQQDGIDRLLGRIGIGAGRKIAKDTQLYTSLSLLHEFKGDQTVTANTLTVDQNMSGSWYEFTLGVTAKLNDHSNGYFNVEKLFGGDVNSNWQVNAGCRWSF